MGGNYKNSTSGATGLNVVSVLEYTGRSIQFNGKDIGDLGFGTNINVETFLSSLYSGQCFLDACELANVNNTLKITPKT